MADLTTKNTPIQLPPVKEGINPFPGLRPFGIDESYLFFGRDGQSEEILNLLSKNRFVAVIGASGTGKSSLIYCGLLPLLYGGFIASAGSSWRIVSFRPGNNPVENLADSISKSYLSQKETETPYSKDFFAAILRHSSFGIAESLKYLPNAGKENILLLADQFEELFRYRKHAQTGDEPEAFVRLLVEAMNQSEIPIYTVLTMRSDFIGECSQYQELTSLINRSNYLIPQMTRDDFRQAVTGPMQVSGTNIDQTLVNQVLNDVGDNPDQLPILQHAMMRTWEYWKRSENDQSLIGLDEYDAIGRLDRALSDHANEAYDELSEHSKRICEQLFKTITEKGADNRGIRRPTKLSDISEITKASTEEVINVIDTFRKSGRSFLTPSHDIPLNEHSIVDLSHESLMRIWNRLKVWVEEESSAVQMYVRLSEASSLYQEGKTGLWRPPDLLLALSWETKQQPSLTWAKRYNPAFERTMVFLRTSEKEFEAEERNKIRQQKIALKRAQITAIVLGTAAIIAVGIMIYANMMKNQAEISKQDAIKQSQIATEQRKLADINAKEALVQKSEALKQKDFADKQTGLAKQQSQIATRNAQEALLQKELADKNSQEATRQRNLSEQNAKEAIQQKTLAEKAREEAYTRRMLSISQAMSIKSLRIDDDKDLKSLLAYQAYLFNKKYMGNTMDPDIYSGLYAAVSSMKGLGYNQYKGHSDAVNAIAFDRFSTFFYTAGSDGKIFKWNLNDSTRKPTLVFENKFVNKCIAINSNNHRLACGTLGNGIIVIDQIKNVSNPTTIDLGALIYSIAFVGADVILAGAENNLVRWDLASNTKEILFTTDGTILSISISPDGKQVALGTRSGKVLLCSTSAPCTPEVLIDDAKSQIYSISFNTAGDKLAIGNAQGYLRLYNIKEGKQEAIVRNHTARITAIRFSLDDKLLATASYDQSAVLWDATNLNAQPVKLKDHESWALALAFNATGNQLITGALREPRIVSWNTSVTSLAHQLQPLIKRNLTTTEWNTYIGSDVPYETTMP